MGTLLSHSADNRAKQYPDFYDVPLPHQSPTSNLLTGDNDLTPANEGVEMNKRDASGEAPAATEPEPPPTTQMMQSGCQTHRPAWHSDFVAHQVKFEAIDQDLYVKEDLLANLDDPILYAHKASNDPDTLYMHEALQAPNAREFKKVVVKEVNDHHNHQHWEVMEKKDVPKGETILRK